MVTRVNYSAKKATWLDVDISKSVVYNLPTRTTDEFLRERWYWELLRRNHDFQNAWVDVCNRGNLLLGHQKVELFYQFLMNYRFSPNVVDGEIDFSEVPISPLLSFDELIEKVSVRVSNAIFVSHSDQDGSLCRIDDIEGEAFFPGGTRYVPVFFDLKACEDIESLEVLLSDRSEGGYNGKKRIVDYLSSVAKRGFVDENGLLDPQRCKYQVIDGNTFRWKDMKRWLQYYDEANREHNQAILVKRKNKSYSQISRMRKNIVDLIVEPHRVLEKYSIS